MPKALPLDPHASVLPSSLYAKDTREIFKAEHCLLVWDTKAQDINFLYTVTSASLWLQLGSSKGDKINLRKKLGYLGLSSG